MTRLLTLYHGTKKSSAKLIYKDGFKISSARKPRSFGDGVYFYDKIEKAIRYSKEEFKTDGRIVEVSIDVPIEKIRRFERYELDESANSINRKAINEGLYVVDASKDDGIYVVRPDAIHLIKILAIHVVSQSLFKDLLWNACRKSCTWLPQALGLANLSKRDA